MDRDAIERELGRLHAESFAWALRCCAGDHGEAEDVLQETYLKVIDGRARYAARASLRTWLFAVIRRTAAGRRRARAVRERLLRRWHARVPDPTPVPGPDTDLEAGRDKERLERAVTGLAPRQRQVVELVFQHDLSLREASRVLGISLGSASRHYARAKRRLLAELEEPRGD